MPEKPPMLESTSRFQSRPARFRTRREEIWRPARFALTSRPSPGRIRQGEPFMHRSISFLLLGSAPILLSGLLSGCGSLDRAAGVATGFVSHQLCSAAFVSQVEPEQFYREAIAPSLAPVGFLVSHKVDREHAEVTASFAGMVQSRAAYRGPLGCLVLHDPPPAAEDVVP